MDGRLIGYRGLAAADLALWRALAGPVSDCRAYLARPVDVDWFGDRISNLIDLDHLLADPIFDPNRCSIGFHLLHGWEAALAFAAMLIVPRWWARAFGLGALWHLAVDYGDCVMQGW